MKLRTSLALSLTLAAAVPAQTVVIAAHATRGYHGRYGDYRDIYTGNSTYRNTISFMDQIDTEFSHVYRSDYDNSSDLYGWLTNFALSKAPAGTVLAAASLSATAAGKSPLRLHVWCYKADSDLVLPIPVNGPGVGQAQSRYASPAGATLQVSQALLGANRLDATSAVAKLIGAEAVYAAFRLEPERLLDSPTLLWSSPTLTLVYGYPVRAALSLGNYVGDATKVPVAYEVRNPGSHEVVASGTLYPDAAGAVAPVVPPGTWDVSLKASHWLRKTLHGVTVVDGSSILSPVALVNGDVNGDNVVSAADRSKVTAALGTYLGAPGYDANADLTGDGFVTAKDRALVTLALGTVGDD